MKTPYLNFQFISLVLWILCAQTAVGQKNIKRLINRTASESNVVRLQDYDSDGDLDMVLIALYPNPGPQETDTLLWLENDPSQLFPKHIIIDEDLDQPVDLDIADLDSDGDLDYVISSKGPIYSNGELAAYQRQADGSYIKWTLEASEDFRQADLGDFDGDGNIDVMALESNEAAAILYLNDGFWNFEEKIVATSLRDLETIKADDIDDDGDIDFVADGTIYINDGNANFTPGDELPGYAGVSISANGIAIVDLNNDGAKDILSFSDVGTAGFYWFDGANGFAPTVLENDNQGLSDVGGDLAVVDLDGNGLKDIIRQNRLNDLISVLYQRSNMVFEREVLEHFWHNSADRALWSVGDIDGDGDTDLAFVSNSSIDPKIAWYENIEGRLYRHFIYARLRGVQDIETGDIDNDGDEDILVSLAEDIADNHEIILYENLGDNRFLNWRINDSLLYAKDVELADIDSDGDLDAFVTGRDADILGWLRNGGFPGDWSINLIEDNANEPMGITIGDIDDDGVVDVALCSSNDEKVFWYRNDGAGNFTRRIIDPIMEKPLKLVMNDFNQDGEMDFMVIGGDTSEAVVLELGLGNSQFNREVLFRGKLPSDLALVDWDLNGTKDVLVSFSASGGTSPKIDLLLFNNDGSAKFSQTSLWSQFERTTALEVFDLDQDGDQDVILGSYDPFGHDDRLMSFALQDAGVLSAPTVLEDRAGEISDIEITSLNDDGYMDILYTDLRNSELAWITLDSIPDVIIEIPVDTTGTDTLRVNSEESLASIPLTIYPNPSTQFAMLSYTFEPGKSYSLEIYDLQGRRLSQVEVPTFFKDIQGIQLDLTRLSPGKYVVLLHGPSVYPAKGYLIKKP